MHMTNLRDAVQRVPPSTREPTPAAARQEYWFLIPLSTPAPRCFETLPDDCGPAMPRAACPVVRYTPACRSTLSPESPRCPAPIRRYATRLRAPCSKASHRLQTSAREKQCRTFAIAQAAWKHSPRADIVHTPPPLNRPHTSDCHKNPKAESRTAPSGTRHYSRDPVPAPRLAKGSQTPRATDNRQKSSSYRCIPTSVPSRNNRFPPST